MRFTDARSSLSSHPLIEKFWSPSLFALLVSTFILSACGISSKGVIIQQLGPLTITSASPLPSAPVNQVYGSSIQASGGTSPYTWAESIPAGGSSNLSPGMAFTTQGVVGAPPVGLLSGTPTAPGIFTFTAQVTDSAQTPANVTKPFTFAISPPNGTLGQPYSQTLKATGGKSPYAWTVASGSTLPSGLSLSAAGVLSGTPSSAGTFNFTLQTKDSSSPAVSTPGAMTLIIAGSTLTVTTASLPSGTVGTAYPSSTLTATGGTTPYSWSWSAASGSSLPPGLTLSGTGTISGTPTAAGTFSFTVQAQDSSSPKQSATKQLSITVNGSTAPPNISSLVPSSAVAGSASLPLTINGTNFAAGAAVTFGTSNLANPVVNAQGTQITATVPSADLVTAGPVPVFVTNPGNVASNQATFTVTAPKSYSQTQVLSPGLFVALDDAGDIAVIGEASISGGNGTASVFQKNSVGNWSMATQLTNSDGSLASVAISGDGSTIVLGSCYIHTCGGHGFVYVAGNTAGKPDWTAALAATATLNVPNPSAPNYSLVGYSVAVDQHGDTVVVGVPIDLTQTVFGLTAVFVRPAAGWSSKNADAVLQDSSSGAPSEGASVSIDAAGDTIVDGALSFGSNSTECAHVYAKPAGGWTNKTTATATLTASGGVNGDRFGISVSISGDGKTVVAGAAVHPLSGSTDGPGAAYVFVNPSAPNGWTSAHQSATLTAQSGNNGDGLGSAVSVSDNGGTIVVGAPGYGTTTPGYAGTAHVFQVPAGGWAGPLNETQILTPSSTSSVTPTNAFGHNASISGDASTIGIGGVATVNGTAHSQVVYMFQ